MLNARQALPHGILTAPQHWAPSLALSRRWVLASVLPHPDAHCCYPQICDPMIRSHAMVSEREGACRHLWHSAHYCPGDSGWSKVGVLLVDKCLCCLCCWPVDWEQEMWLQGGLGILGRGLGSVRGGLGSWGCASIPAAPWVGMLLTPGCGWRTGPPDLTAAPAPCLPAKSGWIVSFCRQPDALSLPSGVSR